MRGRLKVIDTPGFLDTASFETSYRQDELKLVVEQSNKFLQHLDIAVLEAGEQIDAILLVINIHHRFSDESSYAIDALYEIGIDFDHVVVVFTQAGETEKERDSRRADALKVPELSTLIEEVDERYIYNI